MWQSTDILLQRYLLDIRRQISEIQLLSLQEICIVLNFIRLTCSMWQSTDILLQRSMLDIRNQISDIRLLYLQGIRIVLNFIRLTCSMWQSIDILLPRWWWISVTVRFSLSRILKVGSDVHSVRRGGGCIIPSGAIPYF